MGEPEHKVNPLKKISLQYLHFPTSKKMAALSPSVKSCLIERQIKERCMHQVLHKLSSGCSKGKLKYEDFSKDMHDDLNKQR